MNPIRIMAHQSAGYAHDHSRYSGACFGVEARAYAVQRLVNSHDTRVYTAILTAVMASICRLAHKRRWKKAPKGTYERLIQCAVLEHACEGPGWTMRERARQCEMPVVEFRRYRNRYDAIWDILNEWRSFGHRRILKNELRAQFDDRWLPASN